MAILDPILNPIMQPLLNLSPFLGILILAFVISLLITLAYKYLTNQQEMKRLKDEQKEFQKKMKELRSNPEELLKIQKEAMSKNFEYMKQSFKPTLYTMLPILLIFGWMSAHLAYEPIFPNEKYGITAEFAEGVKGEAELVVDEGTQLSSEAAQAINGAVTWNLKSSAGKHDLTVKTKESEQIKEVLITTDLEYEPAVSEYSSSDIKSININYQKLKPLGSSNIPWVKEWGWLGIYLVLSIIFSIVLRKVLKIY